MIKNIWFAETLNKRFLCLAIRLVVEEFDANK